MDRSTKIIQLFTQVFEPYHMMFREMRGGKNQHSVTMFLKRKEKH
jgi:hypothetical protein